MKTLPQQSSRCSCSIYCQLAITKEKYLPSNACFLSIKNHKLLFLLGDHFTNTWYFISVLKKKEKKKRKNEKNYKWQKRLEVLISNPILTGKMQYGKKVNLIINNDHVTPKNTLCVCVCVSANPFFTVGQYLHIFCV